MLSSNSSRWAHTRTFFPIYLELLRTCVSSPTATQPRVLVVGAADGKFVIPLLRMGLSVTAVDVDEEVLCSSEHSLAAKARAEGLDENLEILSGDFRDLSLSSYDSVWTSCSWHYSLNVDRPVKAFIDRLVGSLGDGGLLGAEFMLPVIARDLECDRYLNEGEIWRYLPKRWSLWEAYTPLFVEAPHPGKESEHVHRMGFVVVRKEADAVSHGPVSH